MRRRLLVVITSACLVAACTSDEPGPGEARLVPDGSVEVAEPGDDGWSRVTRSRTVPAGSRVRVLEGAARLELADDARVELREGTRVRVGTVPALLAGDLLVSSPREIAVDGERTRVTVSDGAARLSRSLAFTAAVYDGTAQIESAGRELAVPALRQAALPAPGLIPLRPVPLRYDEQDEWDRRFLGKEIELGRELQAKSRGFTAQLRSGEGRTPGFYRLVLPALEDEPGFGPQLLEDPRTPGELLVGAAIVVQGDRGSFGERWESVFAFRDAGAEWGLVARDQRVDRTPLVAEVDAALGRASETLVFARPTGGGSGFPTTTAPGRDGPGRDPGPTPTTAPPTTRPPSTTTTTLLPNPPPPVPPPPTDPVVEVVDQIVGSLIP